MLRLSTHFLHKPAHSITFFHKNAAKREIRLKNARAASADPLRDVPAAPCGSEQANIRSHSVGIPSSDSQKIYNFTGKSFCEYLEK